MAAMRILVVKIAALTPSRSCQTDARENSAAG
jgi:hypothetical protein